jgi:hypothetical protein
MSEQEKVSSPLAITQKQQEEIHDIYLKLREAEAKLIGPDGKTEILPNNTFHSKRWGLIAECLSGTFWHTRSSATFAEATALTIWPDMSLPREITTRSWMIFTQENESSADLWL